jgi:hypothetical protein
MIFDKRTGKFIPEDHNKAHYGRYNEGQLGRQRLRQV